MSTQIVNISLPKELLEKIDKAAKDQYGSRSEYIRQAVVSRLRAQDGGVWDSLATAGDEVSQKAQQAGYQSDADFVRAVKEVRQATRKQ